MTRAYQPATLATFNAPVRGVYIAPAHPVAATRPTRNAAGMTATYARNERANRRKGGLSPDALRLLVKGTLDSLGGLDSTLERVPCACCGNRTDKLRLREGAAKTRRLRLARLKRERLARTRRLP
jgi:hypothetical protein